MRKYILSALGVTALSFSSTTAFAQTVYPGFGPETEWSNIVFDGTVTNLVADVTGDGKADAVGINSNNIWVMPSTGSSFGPEARWSNVLFDGKAANVLGDVNGDGKADVVGFNSDNIWVMLSTGSSFGPEQEWSNIVFDGTVTNLVADVNGDGRADAVGINSNNIWVMLLTGSSFGPEQEWSNIVFDGAVANVLGDVNGDGKADVVGFNSNNIWVMLSTGSSFGPEQQWSSAIFDETVTNTVADVTGDGKADVVGFNSNNIWVMPSTGSEFGPNQQWSGIVFDGTVANVLGDVNGDGKADAVGFNATNTWVMLSSSFTPPTTLDVSLDPQLENNWCWAASGEMIMSYLGTTVPQCAQANYSVGRTDCCTNPASASNATECDQGGWPAWGYWGFNATLTGTALSFAQLQAEFAANRPVGFAWAWDSGGGHYMVATGASTDEDNVQYVSFNNPWAPNVGDQVTLTYEEWVGSIIGTDPTSGLTGYTTWRDDYGISNQN